MEFRSEWRPRPLSLSKLQELERSIEVIEHLLSEGKSEAAEEKIRVLNEACGRKEEAAFFQNYKSSVSRTELALRLSQPDAVRSADVTRAELIELVHRIQDPHYALEAHEGALIVNDPESSKVGSVSHIRDSDTQKSIPNTVSLNDQLAFLQEFYLELLTVHVSMPGISDLIFWDDLEPEEIVDVALAYRPIALPPT